MRMLYNRITNNGDLEVTPFVNKSGEIWVTQFNTIASMKFREEMLHAAEELGPDVPIMVYINSDGGEVYALMNMLETMDEVPNNIVTVCYGRAISAGAVLLSHGNLRFITKNSIAMVHESSAGTFGDVNDMVGDVDHFRKLNKKMIEILAKNCDIKGGYDEIRQKIKDNESRNIYMDAGEAVKFGIADEIGTPKMVRGISVSLYKLEEKVRKNLKNKEPDKEEVKKTNKKNAKGSFKKAIEEAKAKLDLDKTSKKK